MNYLDERQHDADKELQQLQLNDENHFTYEDRNEREELQLVGDEQRHEELLVLFPYLVLPLWLFVLLLSLLVLMLLMVVMSILVVDRRLIRILICGES